jgi:hypothetical protein
MSKKQDRKLVVKKETLRILAATDLAKVGGGGSWRPNCTGRLSGCL